VDVRLLLVGLFLLGDGNDYQCGRDLVMRARWWDGIKELYCMLNSVWGFWDSVDKSICKTKTEGLSITMLS
jgi:hypothetical protein